ncbi:hypothetical protein VI06_21015 [Aquitalea magnusonii]|nr:hypothetical protein VI06_21015 [Aquitalea magnusonii]
MQVSSIVDNHHRSIIKPYCIARIHSSHAISILDVIVKAPRQYHATDAICSLNRTAGDRVQSMQSICILTDGHGATNIHR